MDGRETVIAPSTVVRNFGLFELILLWAPSKSYSVGCDQAPQSWALKLSSISWPASSKNMNSFHQLPALSPFKKTTVKGAFHVPVSSSCTSGKKGTGVGG